MSAILKVGRVIGDLDDEFYNDEGSRDTWNEASAVGFQMLLWMALITAAALPFVAGRTGANIGTLLLFAVGLTSIFVQVYAVGRGINVNSLVKWRIRPRILLLMALLVIFVVGAGWRLGFDDGSVDGEGISHWLGLATGMAAGAAVGFGVIYIGWRLARTKQRRAEVEAERLDRESFEN